MDFFSHIFKDKELVDIGNKVNDIIASVPTPTDTTPVEAVAGKFIDQFLKQDDSDVNKLFENVTVPAERLARYGVYREINRSVPIIKRIIKVYTSHLLQKNPVDGKCLIYRESQNASKDDEDKVKEAKKFAKQVEEHFDIPKKLKDQVVPKKLLLGNCFVEIVDVKKESDNVDLTDTGLLTESKRFLDSFSKNGKNSNNYSELTLNTDIERLMSIIHEDIQSTAIVERDDTFGSSDSSTTPSPSNDDPQRSAVSEDKDKEETQKDMMNPFLDVILKVHDPNNIIILQSRYGTRIGYLEVYRDTAVEHMSVAQNVSNIIGKITTLSKSLVSEQDIIDKIISSMIKKTLMGSGQMDKKKADAALKSLGDDVYLFVKRLFIEQDIGNKKKFNKIKTRFIPGNRMVDFNVPSNDYSPYGESIIDPLILPCKLYMLAQLSNVIIKLSRAAVVRKWVIDTGSTQMHAGLIQKLKRELYNTRITLDDLSSFKSIPKILSDFKDMFIFSKQGQRALDVEVQSLGDPSIKVADLEDARREIIALSGVPAPYLGYMDVVELREQLVHTNVTFATEISDMQESDNQCLTKILDVIAEIKELDYKPSKYISVNLIPPVVLIVQLIEMTLSSIGNIASVFTNLQVDVDPYFFLEKYVPHIDWKNFKSAASRAKTEMKTKTDLGGEQGGQGGGMF
jgi:hypothetical protein